MRYDLAGMASRAGVRRREIAFAPIQSTRAQANDLAAIYNRMLAPWYGARERIEAAYDRELSRVLQTDAIDDLAALFDDLGREVQRLVLELTPSLQEWALRTESVHRGKWARTVLAGAGVDIRYLIGPQDARETIAAFLARNVALVKDVSAQAQGRISDAVFRGLQQRTPAREVGKLIAEATGMARKRAVRVAADQTVSLAGALDEQRQLEAGLGFWKYRHSGKKHPRSWHRARDGKIYERDSRREVQFVGGKKKYGDDVIAPGDGPTEPPFCACTRQALLVLDGEIL